jgi:hypothetical protein
VYSQIGLVNRQQWLKQHLLPMAAANIIGIVPGQLALLYTQAIFGRREGKRKERNWIDLNNWKIMILTDYIWMCECANT